MAKPGIEGLLRRIYSDEIESVYVGVTGRAIEWAVAGFMQEANKLLENLWGYGTPHTRDLWIPDQGFIVMWHVCGLTPAGIPFPLQDIEDIEKENFRRLFLIGSLRDYPDDLVRRPVNELSGRELYNKAFTTIQYQPEDVSTALEAFEKYFHSGAAVGYSYFHPASCAAVYAARNNATEKAELFINLWGEGYIKDLENYTLAFLMRDRATARLLLTGILAPVFKLTKQVCAKEYEDIAAALAERYANGRSLVYGNLSWLQLLTRISELAIDQGDWEFSPEAVEERWLGKPAATLAEIEETEKRIGVRFPEDYREFLLVSNGFESFSSVDVTLAPVDRVDWLINSDRQLVEIWTGNEGGSYDAFNASLSNSIIIGGHDDEQQLLLAPVEGGKLECWFFATWAPGETRHPSFRFYMEERLQRLEDDFYAR